MWKTASRENAEKGRRKMKTRTERWKSPEATAVVAALVCGFVTHLFGLVNVLHNYDDIGIQPFGYGTGITSGRWFLSALGDLLCDLGISYNLPLVNGLLFLMLLAVAAGFTVNIFHIQNKQYAAVIGMLFTVFPAVTSTMFFRYTTVYYGIAILLSVLAAWVLPNRKGGLVISAVFSAMALGIYQAYIPITIGIFVIQLLQKAIGKKARFRELVREGIYDCVALLAGLVLYFALLVVFLKVYGVSLSNYNGANEMGNLSLSEVPGLLYKTIYYFCMIPFKDYCGIAEMPIQRMAYLVLGICTAIVVLYALILEKGKIGHQLFICGMCVILPVAVNFVRVMFPNVWIYTLMLFSFALVPCVPLVLLEAISDREGLTEAGTDRDGNGCCYPKRCWFPPQFWLRHTHTVPMSTIQQCTTQTDRLKTMFLNLSLRFV